LRGDTQNKISKNEFKKTTVKNIEDCLKLFFKKTLVSAINNTQTLKKFIVYFKNITVESD
jgi:hypothetical protein